METKGLKVAIVHDWLPLIGGAERVLEQITQVFPGADIFTLFDFLTADQKKIFGASKITSSYLNKLPYVKRYYRNLLPFFPRAIESFDLSDYDLVVSSTYSVAKGVITNARQTHISYVHSPARYAWDLMHHYLRESGLDRGIKGHIAKHFLSNFRVWDYRTANGVDHYIANSQFIAQRIWKVYRRPAEVINPPVDVGRFVMNENKEDFYLTASRMVPYKRMDLIVEAFKSMPDRKLVVIGDGPEMEKILNIAQGAGNIRLLGFQETPTLISYMQKAKAFIFAAEEDFGIIPVEAQACGTPVIAYGAGGALETVIDVTQDKNSGTGVFFNSQTTESLCFSVELFEKHQHQIKAINCRKNAEQFSSEKFRIKFASLLKRNLKSGPTKYVVGQDNFPNVSYIQK